MKGLALLALGAVLAAPVVAGLAQVGPAKAQPSGYSKAQVERGGYLVAIASCNDCHTPLKMGPNGPEPDMSRMLSGHPQDAIVKAPAMLSPPWLGAASNTMTAWSGPWGVSFTANLTPDKETGVLEGYTEKQFIQAMRTGRHQGMGRPILPPMPWNWIGKMSDEDLRSVFAYLRQIPPVRNRVPDNIPPAPPPS